VSAAGAERRERLRRRLHELGFDAVRFAAAAPADHGLAAWLAAGHHADMGWMAGTAAKRTDCGRVLAGVRTVIVLGVNYAQRTAPPAVGEPWARYALHADYHDTIGAALRRAAAVLAEECGSGPEDSRGYVDAGPVTERAWAVAAGVGFAGKNANLISRDFGNWLLLATLLTRAELPPDESLARHQGRPEAPAVGLLCGRCTKCLDACPTAAFPAPGVVDARRCISYHTIENRGLVPRELRPRFGARLFGCDTCLAVCPWNRFAQEARAELLERRDDFARLRLLEVLQLTPERFRDLFRGTAVKRTKLTGLRRNACIAAGNVWRSGGPEPGTVFSPEFAGPDEAAAAVTELRRLAADPSPVVRAHAVWALRRVGGPSAAGDWAALRGAEGDPAVLAEYAATTD